MNDDDGVHAALYTRAGKLNHPGGLAQVTPGDGPVTAPGDGP
jgi:hypothetical protein